MREENQWTSGQQLSEEGVAALAAAVAVAVNRLGHNSPVDTVRMEEHIDRQASVAGTGLLDAQTALEVSGVVVSGSQQPALVYKEQPLEPDSTASIPSLMPCLFSTNWNCLQMPCSRRCA